MRNEGPASWGKVTLLSPAGTSSATARDPDAPKASAFRVKVAELLWSIVVGLEGIGSATNYTQRKRRH